MSLKTEARFWQVVGALAAFGGGFLLVHAVSRYGPTSIEPVAIQYGLAGSFMVLAGVLGFLTGRGLHAQGEGMSRLESVLWLILAAVGIVLGALTIVMAKLDLIVLRGPGGVAIARNAGMLILDRLVIGFGGAFAIMLGIIGLLGQRLMANMEKLGGAAESEAKTDSEAKAKAAGT